MKTIALLFLTFTTHLIAKDVPWAVSHPNEADTIPSYEEPWFTGPLLAPSAYTVPRGHINFQPYIYITAITGSYNSHWKKEKRSTLHHLDLEFILKVGITNWMEFSTSPGCSANLSSPSGLNFNDLPMGFGFQILKEKKGRFYPAIKFSLKEIFPTGEYDRFNPARRNADRGGRGSYVSEIGLDFSRMFHLKDIYWAKFRMSLRYAIPTRVQIKGISVYGGEPDTKGILYPPQSFHVDLATEITLSKHWAFACDLLCLYTQSTHFNGEPGLSDQMIPAILTKGASAQYSLAPALEYNWTSSLGIISGAWFTFAGRNTQSFCSWVTALNYFY